MKAFVACENKGFQLSFENGYTISVQWGTGNYCDVKEYAHYGKEKETPTWESNTAEIAVWKTPKGEEKRKFLPIGHGDVVLGWMSADEVAMWMQVVSTASTDDDIINANVPTPADEPNEVTGED